MAILTSILGTDTVSSSRGVINTNFANLNTDKLEAVTVVQVLASTLSTVGITPSVLGETRRPLYKQANQTISTSVFQADNALKFNIGASEIWNIDGYFEILSGAVPDFKYKVTFPESADVRYFSANQGGIAVGSVTLAIGGAATPTADIIKGVIVNSTNPGSVVLAWAQNTDAISSVTSFNKGSFLIANRLQ